MLLSVLTETSWQFAQEGRQKATNRSFAKDDVKQMLKLAAADIYRRLYYSNKKLQGGRDDYYLSPLLSIQNFELGEADATGRRMADASAFDLFRIPNNDNITAIYPVGCGGEGDMKSIPVLQSGEAEFYVNGEFNFFKFATIRGRQFITYHLPPCVKSIDVESSFFQENSNSIDPDIVPDVAFDAAVEVLGRMLGIPDFVRRDNDNSYSLPMKNLRQRVAPQQPEPEV